jgi:O-antigen ligase
MLTRLAATSTSLAALIVGVMAVVLAPAGAADLGIWLYVPGVALATLIAGAFLVWHVHPAYTLSAAIVLSPLAGHWPQFGVPGWLSPDRLLFVGGIAAVLLRAPPVADRPRLRPSAAHAVLGLAAVSALVSALVAGTLLRESGFLKIFDAFGILPFLVFLVAPIAFRAPADRRVLLAALVALGAYLSLTVLFEMAGLDALVFPRYILDPEYGIHFGHGRGPFVDAVACGLAQFTCAVACAIAVVTWRRTWLRVLAALVAVLCAVGVFLSMERSVWIGAAVGATIAMLAARRTRAYLLPVVAVIALAVGAAWSLIPGVSERVRERVEARDALWDRKNLDRAALNMVEARPLIGFGWGRFTDYSPDYFEQADDYPLTAAGVIHKGSRRFGVHNTPLTYAVELGLIGMTLWLVGLVLGVGGALATRGPPDLLPWRVGVLAVAMSVLVVMNAVPPTAWANRSLWLLAGVVYAGRYAYTRRGETAA